METRGPKRSGSRKFCIKSTALKRSRRAADGAACLNITMEATTSIALTE